MSRLSDNSDGAILKIADFGLSAMMFAAGEDSNDTSGRRSEKNHSPNRDESDSNGNGKGGLAALPSNKGGQGNAEGGDAMEGSSPVKRFRSVVGSPHYVAPEITVGKQSAVHVD